MTQTPTATEGRSTTGRRRQRRADLRRARRRRDAVRIGGALAIVVSLGVLVVLGSTLVDRLGGQPGPDPAPPPTLADGDEALRTLLFVTFDERDPAAGASVVFAVGADEDGRATLLLVPPSTIADIPGHGVERVGRAFAYGRAPLVGATVDNLLGVAFGATVTVSEQGWASVVTRLGGLEVDLPGRLSGTLATGRTVSFEPGLQRLDGVRVAEFLAVRVPGEGELSRLARIRHVFDALLLALGESPAGGEEIFADGAPMFDTPIPPERVRAVLESAAAARAAGTLDTLILPVTALATGADATFRIDRERADALVAERFPRAVGVDATVSRRLQILNGNGTPGIGQEVASRVIPSGFRVVLTDNADHFRHDETRVIVHSDSEAQIAAARELVRLLGVGRVEIGRTPQSVVDFTIVVGHDFLRTADRP